MDDGKSILRPQCYVIDGNSVLGAEVYRVCVNMRSLQGLKTLLSEKKLSIYSAQKYWFHQPTPLFYVRYLKPSADSH